MKRHVMRRLQSLLAVLLSLAGLTVAAIPAFAREPEQHAAWLLAMEAADSEWVGTGGPECSSITYELTIPPLTEERVYSLPIECPDMQNLAPGDSGLVGIYKVKNGGTQPVQLAIKGLVDGALFSGDDPMLLTIQDDNSSYAYDGAYHNMEDLAADETRTITIDYDVPLTAGNTYQGEQGTLFVYLRVKPIRTPGGGDDGGGDNGGGDNGGGDNGGGDNGGGDSGGGNNGGGGGRTPPERPPTSESEPPVPASGRITVRVLGDGAGSGELTPLEGAEVQLAEFVANTDAHGQVIFDGLPFGTYTAMATAVNPFTGADPLTGTGATQITAEEPEAFITIVLTWPPRPVPPPQEEQPEPEPSRPTGSLTVRVLDASPRNEGVDRPISGAIVHVGDRAGFTGQSGELRFTDLPLGEYAVFAEAGDPQNPDGPRRSGLARARLTEERPDQVVTIRLIWEEPDPAIDLTPGGIAGRVCAPRTGAARVWATNESGETVATVVAATGRIGVWLNYELAGLTPGTWTLTLQNPGDPAVSQQVIVLPGQAVNAPDFTLACTGDGLTAPPHVGYYIAGGLLLVAGWQLRRMGRKLEA